MATVAEIQVSSTEVNPADKHSDKHHILVDLRERVVYQSSNLSWGAALLGDVMEQIAGHRLYVDYHKFMAKLWCIR